MAVMTISRRPVPHPPACAVLLALSGCSGQQAVTNPQSGDAALVALLWWAMLLIASLVLLAVLVLLATAALRARGSRPERPLSSRHAWLLVLAGGMALPMVVVFGLVISGTHIGAEIAARDHERPAVIVDVEGKRWWWQIRYRDGEGQTIATTANEIHIPAGRPVLFRLHSDNVIHSFWVPNLKGKIDLVPGRINEVTLTADRPGVYRGQCAEYCGTQHALMAFLVIARPAEDFEAWLKRQSAPATEPSSDSLVRGRELFTTAGCAGCHAIRGVQEVGTLGPDLTHIGSRRTLAAGTLANEPDNLAQWITAPDTVKPGALMPSTELDAQQLDDLVAYLESLE